MTKREELVAGHVRKLIDGFDSYVEEYDRLNPFDRSRQLAGHVRTLRIRAELGSASACLADGRYLVSLYETLRAWGIGVRGSRLVPFPAFEQALRDRENDIARLDGLRIVNRPGFHGDFLPWKWRKDHGNQAPVIEAVPA